MIQTAFLHTPHVEYDVEGLSACLKSMLEIRVRCSSRSSPERSAYASDTESALTGLRAFSVEPPKFLSALAEGILPHRTPVQET